MSTPHKIIGILPAGGQATRISPLPMSKELYPIGFRQSEDLETVRPKVVAHYLLEKMRGANIQHAYIILRPGKWDIPAYFGDGAMLDMHLAYLTVHVPHGVPYTVNQAYPFVQEAVIALGFPDILFQPDDAYVKLLDRLTRTRADVVLGLFPTHQPHKAGMVDFDAEGRVRWIVEKPAQSQLQYMWAIAVWSPRFTEFLHQYVATFNIAAVKELPIGDVVQAAIDRGFPVQAEIFEEGTYLDIGTPDDLRRAVQTFSHSFAP